jgi:hypothetical protein
MTGSLSRILLALAVVTTLSLPASLGLAQGAQSRISGEFEIKFGGYRPDIDSEFADPENGPYSRVFGAGSSFYFEGEIDHYLWREFGAFALGLSVGYTSESGKGLLSDGSDSVDETSIGLVPLRLSAIYRFDVLPREYSIPFVPYAKLGVDYYFWWIKSAAGIATYRDPQTNQLDEARGGVFGYHWTLGVQFLLDVLAPQMSRTFDASTGVNNSYIFAEWIWAEIDNFGSDNTFQLGDNTVLFGIAFEY